MKYTINYFLKKFRKIPENKYCEGMFGKDGAHCYISHCTRDWDEAEDFGQILWLGLRISPGELIYGLVEQYQQPSLKERVLVALTDIKTGNAVVKQAKEIITNHKTLQHELHF